MNRRSIVAACVSIVLIGGCATQATYDTAKNSGLINANYEAADRLITTSHRPLSPAIPIVVATIVRLDNLEQSSSLGRLVSEQVSSRFTQRGYSIVELKMRGSIFFKGSEGTFLLSPELRDIAKSHSAQAVVVGTYSVARDYVFINIKLVESAENRVVASYDYQIPIAGQVEALLGAHFRK